MRIEEELQYLTVTRVVREGDSAPTRVTRVVESEQGFVIFLRTDPEAEGLEEQHVVQATLAMREHTARRRAEKGRQS